MCQEKISDYIDDLLPAIERQHMEEHFYQCSICYSIYKDLAMICEASRNLPQCEPREVVWERIMAEISPPQMGYPALVKSGRTVSWFPFRSKKLSLFLHPAMAATLVLVSLAVVAYYRSFEPQPEPLAETDTKWSTERQPRTDVRPTNILINSVVVHKPLIDADLVQQRIDELQNHIETRQSGWSPEVRAVYQRNLRVIDECINRCRGEAANTEAVREVYQAVLRSKLEMLKQFAHL